MNKLLPSIHYGWVILLIGTIGVFCALGLARFGYTTLLPAMQSDLNLSNEQTGLLATYNLIGYLILSVIGGALASHYGIRIVAGIGLLISGIGMILTGFGHQFLTLSIWRCMTGIGSGAANVGIMGLWSAWFSAKKRGMSAGIAVTGASFALILTGIYIPKIINIYGENGWRMSWIIFGSITIAFASLFFFILRNKPSDKNLLPIGNENDNNNIQNETAAINKWKKIYGSKQVWRIGIVYIAFGFSYIIYMTFFVRHLISEGGYTPSTAGKLFMLLGWFSIVSGLIWGSVSDNIGRKKTLVILYLIQTLSFGLFAINNPVYYTTSAILYGLTAWSIPAVMSAICGDLLGQKLAPAALGFITLLFGIGQAAGPFAAGYIADITGSFYYVFILASAIAFIGAVLSFLLKE